MKDGKDQDVEVSAAAFDMISALGFTDFRELEAMVVGVSVSRRRSLRGSN